MNSKEKYIELRKEIDDEIIILKQRLRAMDAKFKKDPANWGFAGNCDNVLNYLNNVNEFLGD